MIGRPNLESTPGALVTAETSPTIACSLGVGDQAAQAARWARVRETAELSRAATAGGIRLAFRDDRETQTELEALIEVEKECCSWARWSLARHDGALVLDAWSSGDGIEVLRAMFGPEPSGQDTEPQPTV
jgi:hypothetical protein